MLPAGIFVIRRERTTGLNMLCQICHKNDATIHLTEITDGVRAEMHICEHCATEQDISVNELLSNLLAVQPTDDELSDPSELQLACPNCGFTLDQFRKEGLLGCAYDYEVFEKLLTPLIEKAHNGRTSHCGKVPSKAPKDTKSRMRLLKLRQQLETAVYKEDYELAAKLRDEIERVEK
jgi:protein arginine kinase activator